jgi:carboxylesterase type B
MQRGDPTSSEDCLYLNIFVKSDIYLNRNITLAPILFFIHGGGFVSGTPTTDYYEGSTLASYSGVIVVTIQYRLDSFGFLHLSESDAVGNQGFLDQHLALKWIYDNADKFGGDRNKITLAGESVGGFSVGYHLMYEKSWPYFRNAIMESGGPTSKVFPFISSAEANTRGRDLFAVLGCTSSFSNSEILKCAQKIDPLAILNATYTYLNQKIFTKDIYSYLSVTPFPFVIANRVFNQSIEKIVENRALKKCKIITGFNSDEFGYHLALLGLAGLGPDPSKWDQNARAVNSTRFLELLSDFFYYYPKYPEKRSERFASDVIGEYFPSGQLESKNLTMTHLQYLNQIVSDFVFTCQSFEIAEVYSRLNLQAYVYSYEHLISTSIFPQVIGVVHTDELAMLFAQPLSSRTPPFISQNYWSSAYRSYSNAEKKFNENFLNYWINFIKYDDPNYSMNSGLNEWKPFVSNARMRFNFTDVGGYLTLKADDIEMKTGYSSHRCVFWNYTRLVNSSNRLLAKNRFNFILLILYFFRYLYS